MSCGKRFALDDLSRRVGHVVYTVDALPIKSGYFRFGQTDDVYPCPDERECSGDDCGCAGVEYQDAVAAPARTYGGPLCHPNARGPLCALCQPGHYRRPRSIGDGIACPKCKPDSVLPIFVAAVFCSVALAVIVASGLAVTVSGRKGAKRRARAARKFLSSRWALVAGMQVWYAVTTMLRFWVIEKIE